MIRHERLLAELHQLGLSGESLAKHTRLNAAGPIDTFWKTALVAEMTKEAA